MKKTLIYITLIALLSCDNQQKNSSEFEQNFGMYSMLISELDSQCFYLDGQINYELSELKMEKIIYSQMTVIDSITAIYTNKIDDIISELSNDLFDENDKIIDNQNKLMSYEKVNNYFFKGDSLSDKGKSFKESTNDYRNEILKYFEHPIYIESVQGSFTMNDVQDRYGKKTEFLNYLYRDTPLIAVMVQLKSFKRNSLQFQQQLFK